ncbi:MAG: hypothetical protein QNJ17_09655 [Desulfocapsaceae bacterium]|nr:hypothetical protein [Desulfocapsaceae bacterium]
MTINTWKGDGNYDWRMQMMAKELYCLEPDVICLQESVQTVDFQIDTADYLADYLDMDMIYAPARLKNRDIEKFQFLCHSGLAILSANAIDRHWLTNIPTSAEDPERMALSAQLYLGNELFTITNLHLTHVTGMDELRFEQLTTIIEENSEVAENSRWFCCGDCNYHIDQTTLDSLARDTRLQVRDCYLAGGGQLPGGTLVKTNRPLAESRLDYIFFLLNKEEQGPEFLNGRIVLDTPDFEGCYPSDHFGVCVDINFSS